MILIKTFSKFKTRIIVNPQSDRGKTATRWERIKEALKHYIKEFKYEFTEKPLQAIELTRESIKEGFNFIVGVGGDGTLNEIANGFFEENKIINPEAKLGIIPSGTGCDFIKSLKIPKKIKNALEIIKNGSPFLIDIGKAVFRDFSGRKMERYFINVADFGLGGEVVKRVNEKRMERKTSSYLKELILTMVKYKNKRLKISVDGKELPEDEYLVGAIANGKIFGGGMKIAPGASLNDGLFDFVVIRGFTFLEFLRHGWKVFFGTHLKHPKAKLIRGKRIKVECMEEEKVLLELDGEQPGILPAEFEIIPLSLKVQASSF
ncbi:diacylglycerol kinase family lipid kinase [Candidatus Aminicenantes bacterium AC-335-A11]|jgi:YegS/Rv2252/BmrU family lipid kinase|nr:diacylglycerol kinase family lipid kinase [SCandidatus Aminicenantes bacterium Aminicenantia_JdfR_composite]MCP2597617.1 diacylglycerol kinase family lipid kinase [Candidatus Aminicenantes bacterium AC-335-G13]MCP2598011.1 diacylglycerol kinase family lipid kinase [Candidatus Aminicenantes bacterium AC-335-L06]MCP2606162.1 diacylglycerol kinase family lipid kinase [Candidatus Aminicenantes bacterium AC-708-I09]MCP2618805.1 diacylglycerol kinase family lipid kinase [Candidatus Aminicenantes b